MKKTFAQLKRDLQVGVKVKTIANYCKPERNGEIREISKVQSNAIAFKTNNNSDSWLWWPKASQIEYEDNIFKVYEKPCQYNNFTSDLMFVYEIQGE